MPQQPIIDQFKQDPWLAVNLSALFPGVGQIYAGKVVTGLGFILIEAALIFYAGWSLFAAEGNTLWGLALILPISLIYVANLFETYRAITGTGILEAGSTLNNPKNPWFAVFLGQFLPGLGHLYAETTGFAIAFLVALILLPFLGNLSSFFLPSLAIVSAMSCYHAYTIIARRTIPRRQKQRSQLWLMAIVVAIVITRLLVVYVPLQIQRAIVPFQIPSKSMIPTLQVGDRILVHRAATYRPETGDLIVFHPVPSTVESGSSANKYFVKRVIGKPGQTIEIRAGEVLINTVLLAEPYLQEPPFYNFGPVVVPDGQYIVLGDNRNDSFDSHVWGFLPQDNIVGKAYKIYWPPDRMRSLLKPQQAR